jgi:hypothetical protein
VVEMMEVLERKKRMKEWAIKIFGDIPRAYPFRIVISYAPRDIKHVIDSSTPILAESVIEYINHVDPEDEDENEVIARVELPDGTTIDCTPANFLTPSCIHAYYYASTVRLFLDFKRVDP